MLSDRCEKLIVFILQTESTGLWFDVFLFPYSQTRHQQRIVGFVGGFFICLLLNSLTVICGYCPPPVQVSLLHEFHSLSNLIIFLIFFQHYHPFTQIASWYSYFSCSKSFQCLRVCRDMQEINLETQKQEKMAMSYTVKEKSAQKYFHYILFFQLNEFHFI